DWWSNVFQDIEKLRSVVPHVNKPRGKPEGFVARLFSRWKHESFAEEIATMNRELYRRIGHLPHDSDSYLSLVDRLRGHIRMAFAESSGADSTRSEKFHRCFVDAIRYRYCIVHDPDRWSVEHELEWMKRYIDLPVHTPWLTNYILAAVFDRRITEARSELRSFFGGVRSFFGGVWITLSFMLAIVIG